MWDLENVWLTHYLVFIPPRTLSFIFFYYFYNTFLSLHDYYSGNLYYFTWLSFLVSVAIVSACYQDLTGGAPSPATNNNGDDPNNKANNGEIQIEQLPPDHEQF